MERAVIGLLKKTAGTECLWLDVAPEDEPVIGLETSGGNSVTALERHVTSARSARSPRLHKRRVSYDVAAVTFVPRGFNLTGDD